MHRMLIETESTPNPATLKFLPGRAVMETATRDFASPEEAEASPLASALFSLGDVTGVFFGRDFVSVTIAPGAEWSDVKPDVLGIVMDHFLADVPLFNAASAGFSVPGEDESFADDPADADEPQPPFDPNELFVLLDGLRRAAPGELEGQVTKLIREFLLTLPSLIDWYLERLDAPRREPDVEDILIEQPS